MTNTMDKYQAYRKRVLFSFNVTSSMTPTSDVIAFFKADDGEVVADRLAVGVPDVIESDVSKCKHSAELLQCCFTSTETMRTTREGQPRTSTTPTFTQLHSSDEL